MQQHGAKSEFQRRLLETRLASGRRLIDYTELEKVVAWWFVDFGFDQFLERLLNGGLSERPRRARFAALEAYKRLEVVVHALESILVSLILFVFEKKRAHEDFDGKPKVLFTAQNLQWRVIKDDETGLPRKSDAFFDTVLKHLREEAQCIGVFPLSMGDRIEARSMYRGLQILADKLHNWYIPQRPFEHYWSLNASHSERRAAGVFGSAWRSLERDETFRRICDGIGDSASKWTRARLEYYFRISFPRAVRYVEIAKRLIDKEKPNLIVLLNEYGLFERTLLVAAKQRRVPTLALQHGDIHPFHRGYMYIDSAEGKKGESFRHFIPDMTAVYGEYQKRLLTACGNYPSNCVVVTGQPRYDRLHRIDKIYSRERFFERYGIPSHHRLVLWTTQCQVLSPQENVDNFRAVFGAIKAVRNVTLVIKQHPGEDEHQTEMIRHYLGGYEISAVLTPPSSDTYEMLFACDLLITKTSTTGMEAVALGKPVILLALAGRLDSVDYVGAGVAVAVFEQERLAREIEKLLRDDSELATNRKAFVKKYLNRIDGKATARVANLILHMADQSTSASSSQMRNRT